MNNAGRPWLSFSSQNLTLDKKLIIIYHKFYGDFRRHINFKMNFSSSINLVNKDIDSILFMASNLKEKKFKIMDTLICNTLFVVYK
jgi:hypothetical protein